MKLRRQIAFFLFSAPFCLPGQQLGPGNEPAAMGSSYQPLFWQGADAQFALDAARLSRCQIERDTLVGSRASDNDVAELAAHSLSLNSRTYKQLHSMAGTIGFELDSKKHSPECANVMPLKGQSGDAFVRHYLDALARTNTQEIAHFRHETQLPPDSANYELKKFAFAHLSLFRCRVEKNRPADQRRRCHFPLPSDRLSSKEMASALNQAERQALIDAAIEVAQLAYAPYSRFRVGAAVLGSRGLYLGTNVENSSSGLSLCAERSALAAAVAAGDTGVKAIAVACVDAAESSPPGARMPCGACRQWIAELAPNAAILVAGIGRSYSILELLPSPFSLQATDS